MADDSGAVTMESATAKKTLAVWKFSSCDGCQLSLLDCEDELLAIAGELDIAYFLEATSASVEGPYDVSLVEGSVTTQHELETIKEIRENSRTLITIGACATRGGIQALRNFADVEEFTRLVYATPDYIIDAVELDPDQRGRPRRLRASGLPDLQAAAARGDQRLPRASPSADPGPQRLRRVQASRHRVRHGRPRDGVSRTGHSRRLRRDLSELQPRLLRLLRTDGDAEHAVPRTRGAGSRTAISSASIGPTTPRANHSGRRASAMSTADRTVARFAPTTSRASRARARCTCELDGDEVVDCKLRIYEPPRFFEAFLRGRAFTEAPDITSRICGICPIAYQMSAVRAMEDACGVAIDERPDP